ncbi:Ribosomal RNA-processing protein 15 [Pseudocercospora fuligena]|uniref:Ribosomal RNA-processing protein 15 n=1 Tax=Pseudocercospora fuligena TaxID=685502 RepID=A0A8H6RHQ3_9PEZI|nr:Ribosomal RNA-processing protein 15 [Pseudocercospora fuligena]
MKMAPIAGKKRRVEDEVRPKKKKFIKKQKTYHSSSEDEEDGPSQRASDAPRPKYVLKAQEAAKKPEIGSTTSKPKSILKRVVSAAKPPSEPSASGDDSEDAEEEEEEADGGVDVLEKNTALNGLTAEDSEEDDEVDISENDEPDLDEASSASQSESDGDASITSSQARNKKKRNDPDSMATSMLKILDTKLTASKRANPLLSRSKTPAEADKQLADAKLESKARAQIRAEKRALEEKGHVADVLGLQTPNVDTGAILEEEKRLKKTAQRGVVKLFNAVRAAQVKAEEARAEARKEGVVGMKKREERVNEMSKQGFLDLISKGGKPVEA